MKSFKVRITESIVDVLCGLIGVATLAALLYWGFIVLIAIGPVQCDRPVAAWQGGIYPITQQKETK